jgi:hypothetical protein
MCTRLVLNIIDLYLDGIKLGRISFKNADPPTSPFCHAMQILRVLLKCSFHKRGLVILHGYSVITTTVPGA